MEKREGATEIPNRHACSSQPVFGKIGAVGQNDGVVLRCQTGHLIIYSEPSRECFRLSVSKRNEVGKTVSEVANPVSRIEITSRLTRKTVSRPLKRHRAWGKQGLLFIRQGGTRERLAEKPAAFRRRSARLHYLFIRQGGTRERPVEKPAAFRPPFRSFALSLRRNE